MSRVAPAWSADTVLVLPVACSWSEPLFAAQVIRIVTPDRFVRRSADNPEQLDGLQTGSDEILSPPSLLIHPGSQSCDYGHWGQPGPAGRKKICLQLMTASASHGAPGHRSLTTNSVPRPRGGPQEQL